MNASDPEGRVSAILPNHNHARFLGQAVQALADQRPAPCEIIVVDDASTDDSLAVLASLAAEFPSLRVIREEARGGAIVALNRGLAEAKGDYVYFGAADDVVCPGLLGGMVAALARHPGAGFASGECRVVDLSGRQTGMRPAVRPSHRERFFAPGDVVDLLRQADNWVLTGAAVFRRDAVRAAGGFNPDVGSFADGLLVRHLALRHGFVYVPRVGVVWRINPAGLSRSALADASTARQTIASMLTEVRADPLFPPWYPAVLERRWRFGVGRIAAVEANPMRSDLLRDYCAHGGLDRWIFTAAAAMNHRIGALLALGWLTLRERPMSLSRLLATDLVRFVERIGGRARI